MASIVNDPNGRKRIQFFDHNGERQTIRLGKTTKQNADTVKLRIELLVTAKINGTAPDADTSRWVADTGDVLHAKLAKYGLVAPRVKQTQTALAEFLDGYIAKRTDIKPNTRSHLERARNSMVECWGAERSLDSITPNDADSFRLWLLEKMGDNTVRRICGRAKQFFRAAQRAKLIAESPFADMKGTNVRANKSRDYFISRADAVAILEACPDTQWQLIFALSRYGGLRCPSEHLALMWDDVDWHRGRMTVRSPKTEHHEGKDSRVVPIFPELRPYLDAAWEQAPPGTVHVISRYRDPNANLRSQMLRIIGKAKVKPWPKLFQNLRATRETELAEQFPIHVVCEWIGNSQAVAAKHYLQVTDAHFEAAQNPAQSAADCGDYERQDKTGPKKTSGKTPIVACGHSQLGYLAPPVGLEPTT